MNSKGSSQKRSVLLPRSSIDRWTTLTLWKQDFGEGYKITMKQLKDYPLFSMTEKQESWIQSHTMYLGDIHNHCGISYGHGTLAKAIDFARQQLDFCSVTGHFAWPDMENTKGMDIPKEVRAYHKSGFAKLRQGWPSYLQQMENAETAAFLPFPSYEYHSFLYGDYTVLCRHQGQHLPEDPPAGEPDLRLKTLIERNDPKVAPFLAFPHHIGYKQGFRGINWDAYNERTSPIVEILSMHGCAESHEAKLSYLHTMGPRSQENTMQGGLKRGYRFGVVANTDHHNASPGSYGFGRTGVYAPALTRDAIWNALVDKQTIAFSGDGMRMALFLNDRPFASEAAATPAHIDAYLVGFDCIDRFELVHDGKVVASGLNPTVQAEGGFLPVTFGWGEKDAPCYWQVEIRTEGTLVADAVPRLRGNDMVDPLEIPDQDDKEKTFFENKGGRVIVKAATNGNKTATTNSTQGCVIETAGRDGKIFIKLHAQWKGYAIDKEYEYSIGDLAEAPKTEYIHGFVSPAIAVGPFTPLAEASSEIHIDIPAGQSGAYYVRAYEKNGDGAYSTPVWVNSRH